MILLSDVKTSEFKRGKDKKPRKKRNWKGVVGNTLTGAAVGGGLGDYTTGVVRPGTSRMRRVALATGLVGGALAAGISKYRNNNRTNES